MSVYVYCSIREKVFAFYNICMHTVSCFFSTDVLYWGRELSNWLDLVITLILIWNSLLSMDFLYDIDVVVFFVIQMITRVVLKLKEL